VIRKNILYLFLSKFLFLSFSHGSWTEKEVLQRYLTRDKPLFGTLWAVSIEEKDTETGISCTSNPFTLHEFSVPGRLDWYAVWIRWILLIHYDLSRPLAKFTNLRPLKSKTAEEVACQLTDIFCMFGAPFILQSDNGQEFGNKIIKKLGWFVAMNEVRAWKAETFSKSTISWKIQPKCPKHAGCFDVRQQHDNLIWRTSVYPKQENPSSTFRHQDKPL